MVAVAAAMVAAAIEQHIWWCRLNSTDNDNSVLRM